MCALITRQAIYSVSVNSLSDINVLFNNYLLQTMTLIDFYILENSKPNARQLLACKIAEKAYKQGRKIYIHTESEQQTSAMDKLLWTFRGGSFIPHFAISQSELTEKNDKETPVLIGHEAEPKCIPDVLINLSHDVPGFFSRFERVAELVTEDATQKQKGRERYKYYRDRGYELRNHTL